MLKWSVLAYGGLLALIDAIMMPITKGVATKSLPMWVMIVPTLIYAADPWIFLQSLRLESMVVMNFVWDLLSDVLVTFVGLFILGEKLSFYKGLGVCLSFISIFLLTCEEGPCK